jgi:hypothetical protein
MVVDWVGWNPERIGRIQMISEIRTSRAGNATTRSGKVVHRSERDGYPSCGNRMGRIVYTDRDVNCEPCLSLLSGEKARRTVSEFIESRLDP